FPHHQKGSEEAASVGGLFRFMPLPITAEIHCQLSLHRQTGNAEMMRSRAHLVISFRRFSSISDSSHESGHRPIWSGASNSRGILMLWEPPVHPTRASQALATACGACAIRPDKCGFTPPL